MTIEDRLDAIEEQLTLILNRISLDEQENLSISKACRKLQIGRRRFISLVLKYKLPIQLERKGGNNPQITPEQFEKLQTIVRQLSH